MSTYNLYLYHFSCYVIMLSDKCSQPPRETGPCYNYVMQYSYVSSSGHCEAFYYGGCEGNDNMFESREECESKCITTTTSTPTVESSGYYIQSLLPFVRVHSSWLLHCLLPLTDFAVTFICILLTSFILIRPILKYFCRCMLDRLVREHIFTTQCTVLHAYLSTWNGLLSTLHNSRPLWTVNTYQVVVPRYTRPVAVLPSL